MTNLQILAQTEITILNQETEFLNNKVEIYLNFFVILFLTGCQQVMNPFIVYFKITYLHSELQLYMINERNKKESNIVRSS